MSIVPEPSGSSVTKTPFGLHDRAPPIPGTVSTDLDAATASVECLLGLGQNGPVHGAGQVDRLHRQQDGAIGVGVEGGLGCRHELPDARDRRLALVSRCPGSSRRS